MAREQIYRATLAFVPYHGEMLPDERMPLVYRPLVEFLMDVPWEALVRIGEDRPLVRRAFADVLPPVLSGQRADSRHSATVIEGLRAAWTDVAPLLNGDSLAALGAVDARRYRQAINGVLGGYLGENPQCLSTTLFLEPWLTVWAGAHGLDHSRRLPMTPAH